MSNRQGRPKGAKNITTIAEVQPSRCPTCGSSKRSAYRNTVYRDYAGAGLAYVGMFLRSCACEECGQSRIDREKVYASDCEAKPEWEEIG